MICSDPGHVYQLTVYDGPGWQPLVFMKREGPGYPFNIGRHAGTNCQEVIRALIDRCLYLNSQIPCGETEGSLSLLRQTLWLFEARAARRHGRVFDYPVYLIEREPVCQTCGHIGWAAHSRPMRDEEY